MDKNDIGFLSRFAKMLREGEGMSEARSKLARKIDDAAGFIEKQLAGLKPVIGVVLGTGLGGLSREMKDPVTISYGDIPHFMPSALEGHAGELVVGDLGGRLVATMEGRYHFYEGYTLEQVTLPVRVLRRLGCAILVVSNACGAMNPQFKAGDLMFIEDHINLMGINPLIGPNDESLGPRFPDMCEPYSHDLIDRAEKIAMEEKIRTHRGIYVAVTGPNLETRAEYRFLRAIGADVVGMSTVPEVIVAVHMGFKVLGVSIVTDTCLPDALRPINIEEIFRVAGEAEPKLKQIVRRFVAEVPV